jgi:hypothetical protein
MPRRDIGQVLPAANSDVDIKRIQLDRTSHASSAVGCQEGSATAAEWVEDDTVAAAAVPDQVGN